jgi:hypothetical protein
MEWTGRVAEAAVVFRGELTGVFASGETTRWLLKVRETFKGQAELLKMREDTAAGDAVFVLAQYLTEVTSGATKQQSRAPAALGKEFVVLLEPYPGKDRRWFVCGHDASKGLVECTLEGLCWLRDWQRFQQTSVARELMRTQKSGKEAREGLRDAR